jgi:hypothetical protein
MIGTANLFSHLKAMSGTEQFIAEYDRSLTPVRGHQSVSIPEQRGHREASAHPVCDLASIRNELACSLEWLAVDDERELTAEVWLVVADTHACTHDALSGGRAERTRRPIQNVLAREVWLLRWSRRCSVPRSLLSIPRDFVLSRSANSVLEHGYGFL